LLKERKKEREKEREKEILTHMVMAKWMTSWTQAKGIVLLGTVIIKCLQMLVWWVQDHQK
jgi:hypothetical protein